MDISVLQGCQIVGACMSDSMAVKALKNEGLAYVKQIGVCSIDRDRQFINVVTTKGSVTFLAK